MLVFVACANQQRDDELVGDETESYEEVILGQRRPDSLAIDWTNKMVYVLEFKRTSDQRRDYRERGESRALALFGLGTRPSGPGLKHMRSRSHQDPTGALVIPLLLWRTRWSIKTPAC